MMVRIIQAIVLLVLFAFLTILTQIGGVVLLLSILTYGQINKRIENKAAKAIAKALSFLTLYLVFVFIIVPPIAGIFGRVPLPVIESNHVRPANVLTAVFNRNYVRPELRHATIEVARQMNEKYPGTTLNYLDANFPFINGFPLVPHLSHYDGRKLDVAFHYRDKRTGETVNEVPSWLGYGVNEEPQQGEFDRPAECAKRGFWQYSFLSSIISQRNKASYPFDPQRTRDLANFFTANKSIALILIEPHLKSRLKLTSKKVRLHGCNAVRHDDHIHVQAQ